MSLPVCTVCAKSGVLCPSCEAKLGEGRINEFDVEVSRILYELLGEEANFTRAIDTENYVVILTGSGDVGGLIGKGGGNIKEISKRLGKQVRVVGEGDFNEMVKAFIAPARVNGINTVYRPDGTMATRIRVDARGRGRLRVSPEDLRRLVSGMTDRHVELAFD